MSRAVLTTLAPLRQTPSFSASLAIDWSKGSRVEVTLTGNFSPTFSGAIAGQHLLLMLRTGAGSFTVTLPATVRYSTDLPSYTATTAASKIDRLAFIYDATDSKYDLVAVLKGLG